MSRTDGQINRWTDEQDWFYRTPTTKMEVQSCSLEIRKNFLKLFGLIVSNMERINTRKGNTINRQIHWFLFLSVIVKKFMLTKSSWKFKTSSWIPNHGVLNQTLNNTDFYLSTFAATKIQSRVEYYSITINMLKSFNQFAQFIKSFVIYTWFNSPMIYKASPIFDHAHSIIIKVTFSFHKFASTCKKLTHFINSFLRYSRF